MLEFLPGNVIGRKSRSVLLELLGSLEIIDLSASNVIQGFIRFSSSLLPESSS